MFKCKVCNLRRYYKLQDKNDLAFEGIEWELPPPPSILKRMYMSRGLYQLKLLPFFLQTHVFIPLPSEFYPNVIF